MFVTLQPTVCNQGDMLRSAQWKLFAVQFAVQDLDESSVSSVWECTVGTLNHQGINV